MSKPRSPDLDVEMRRIADTILELAEGRRRRGGCRLAKVMDAD